MTATAGPRLGARSTLNSEHAACTATRRGAEASARLARYLVSPFSRRVLLVVAAAIRSATLFERPRAVSLRLMSSYCRLRFALFTPRGGMCAPPRISYLFVRATAKSGPHGLFVGTLRS